jgi:RES domain-containing protein
MTFEEIIHSAKDLSMDELKKLVGNILSNVDYGSIYCTNQTFSGLYRARQHSQINGQSDDYIFTNEKEYWNPSEDCINELGRCNDIGESMFYSSNHFETAILEVRPIQGQFITVARFLPNSKGHLLPSFRIKPNCIQHLKRIKGFKSCITDFDLSKRDAKFLEVDNLLDDLFTEVVNEDESYKYKVSNAITKCMLANTMDDAGNQYSMNGMIYPSIVNNMKSINVLLKPIYAINNYHIASLQTLNVFEVTNNKVSLKLVRNGHTVGAKEHPSQQLDIKWHPEIDGPIENIEY